MPDVLELDAPAETFAPTDDFTAAEEPLSSLHTSNFPNILRQLNISLAVSTYQAGKLVLLRPEGELLNTHFRPFNKPMGIAIDGNRMAVGTAAEIAEFRDIPAVASRIEDEHKPDACYLHKMSHVTGDIQIHEMEYGTDDLWFVNTAFSCLCTRSDEFSFQPRWRPPFISGLAPEDRCHLNGMAMVNGRPKYVTALGHSDSKGGWRDNKASGGLLMDVDTNEVIVRGLSMPHSPRVYQDKLWVLNSGEGGIGIVDQNTGRYEQVAELPGFTRGLSFIGNLAFIGLSQVRESAVFSGIRIAKRDESERWSGVAVVDITAGKPIAWLRFENLVQEVFAVSVIPGRTRPDLLTDEPDVLRSSYLLPTTHCETCLKTGGRVSTIPPFPTVPRRPYAREW